MFKISVIESGIERRLVLAGRLAATSVPELKTALKTAKVGLGAQELIVDIKNLTAISEDGENAILDLMNEGATIAWITPQAATERHASKGPYARICSRLVKQATQCLIIRVVFCNQRIPD